MRFLLGFIAYKKILYIHKVNLGLSFVNLWVGTMEQLNTLGERLQYAIKNSPKTLKEIAAEANLSTQAIHQAIKKNAMTDENLTKIADITGNSSDWLITGATNRIAGIDPAELMKCISLVKESTEKMGWELSDEKVARAALLIIEEHNKTR